MLESDVIGHGKNRCRLPLIGRQRHNNEIKLGGMTLMVTLSTIDNVRDSILCCMGGIVNKTDIF